MAKADRIFPARYMYSHDGRGFNLLPGGPFLNTRAGHEAHIAGCNRRKALKAEWIWQESLPSDIDYPKQEESR